MVRVVVIFLALFWCHGLSAQVIEISDSEFRSKVYDYTLPPQQIVYKGTLPCIVEFYASWCSACKMVNPRLEAISKRYKDKIIVYKINIDKYPDLAKAYAAKSVPLMLYCPVDSEPGVIKGAASFQILESRVKSFLLNK